MINKKNIISTVVLVGAIAVTGLTTFGVKSNADEETLSQVKQELQQQIDDKTTKLEEKDKQIEDLNTKITEQQSTIDNLNNTVSNLSGAVNATQEDLNTAKAQQKSDKKEVTTHTDQGDADLQQQIDTINSAVGENREVPKPSVGGDIGYKDNGNGSENGTR